MVSKVRCWIGWLIFSLNSSNEYRLDVYSGIPQGGVLRQVLFIQYVNDLPEVVQLIYGYKGVNLKEIAKDFFLSPCILVMSLEY